MSTALFPAPLDASWRDEAACHDADPELFFATSEDQRRGALAYCARCPVRRECLEHALTVPEPFGIWGGVDEYERHRLLRRRTRAA